MTGIDLIRHIREEMNIPGAELRLMLLHSTINDSELIAACSELDVEYNIAKPITSEQLYYLLNTSGKSAKLSENDIPEDNLAEFEKHSCTILIAEDNPLNQVLIRTLVQKILPKAQIIVAEDGAKAVDCYLKQKPDLILMDIQMPVQSGLEATEKIRKMEGTNQNVPIIALTARALMGEKEECLQSGMNDYLTKPIIFEHFKDMLGRYLRPGQ
jgi:CheY-like chemotaxis protein